MSREDPLAYRVRVLPDQLARARARLRQLENEAERYRMFDLIPHRQQGARQ